MMCIHRHTHVCNIYIFTHTHTNKVKESEFGAEKGLLQGRARYIVPKNPGALKGFQQTIITGQLRELISYCKFLVSEDILVWRYLGVACSTFLGISFWLIRCLTMCYLFPQICRLSNLFSLLSISSFFCCDWNRTSYDSSLLKFISFLCPNLWTIMINFSTWKVFIWLLMLSGVFCLCLLLSVLQLFVSIWKDS